MITTTLQSETTTAHYTIPQANLWQFEQAIIDLNKRARRLGVAEVQYSTEVDHVDHEYRHKRSVDAPRYWSPLPRGLENDYVPTGRVREWLRLTVTGEAPKYAGWSFIATLSPLAIDEGPTANVVRVVPGEICPPEYRERVGECDHCRTHRRRAETFVVRHEDGAHKMVGRQCLKDFLGHTDPHKLARWAELWATLGEICADADHEFWPTQGHEPQAWTLEHFLRLTSASIRVTGWCSGKEAYESHDRKISTKAHVLTLLTPPPAGSRAFDEWRKDRDACDPTEADEERAARAITWAEILNDNETLNDYLYNLALISRAGYVTPKNAGYAASILIAHAKHEEREIERCTRESYVNEWIGEPGEIIETAVRCERVITLQSEYGTTGLHKMRDVDGRSFTWFASSSAQWMDEGDVWMIRASVKKHDEYKGWKQTVLTRVRDISDTSALTAQIEAYDAKPKLTKAQQRKRDRLADDVSRIQTAVLAFNGPSGNAFARPTHAFALLLCE